MFPLFHWRVFSGMGLGLVAAFAWGTPQVKIQPIGDSITLGAGQSVRGGGYRAYLEGDYAWPPINFVGTLTDNADPLLDKEHDGHGGWSSWDLVNGRDGQGTVGQWVATWRPDVILLMIGRNDVYPWTDDAAAYRAIADQIFSAMPKVTVLWSNVLMPADDNAFERQHCETADAALRQVSQLETLFKGRKVVYLDFYRQFGCQAENYSDSVHLSDLGYQRLAALWHEAVLQWAQGRNQGSVQIKG